ncbi:hypothetical protein TRFO_24693 [Tritrichomonas foetus]|uniref:DUF4200 domain-containing protein n=1 Tax=Tritrichomonas foetus TaxID=1144522 RepID=A0A1J4K6F5_9EUKA|nr:hypothetical protein TRFO_24693 [Tritrichomonas foetus]|eukprot:OHT07049.1 hypothetical protein TRFO_24693 [Tritrichomonas foetus]
MSFHNISKNSMISGKNDLMKSIRISRKTPPKKAFFSTTDQPALKHRFFGYTAPLPGDASDKRRKAASKFSDEMVFITQTTSRFSLQDPSIYIKNATPGVFEAHIEQEINIQKNKIHQIKNSDEYFKYRELCVKREVLANELLRIEQENAQIVIESNKAAQRLAKYIAEISSPKSILDLRTASNYQDESDRLSDLYQTQSKALNERKKRKLLCEMNEAKAQMLIKETEQLKGKAVLMRQKFEAKKKNDVIYIEKLRRVREEMKGKLIEFFNENDQDLDVKIGDLVQYVKNEDPIIQLRNFQKYKYCLNMKKLEDLADSSFIEEKPEKNVFKWE